MVQETTGSEAIESSTKLPTEPTTSLIEKTDSTRDERAAELVDRLSLWSGAAGLIPVPLVDVAAVWGCSFICCAAFPKSTEFHFPKTGANRYLPA
jgi:hypothetical protein